MHLRRTLLKLVLLAIGTIAVYAFTACKPPVSSTTTTTTSLTAGDDTLSPRSIVWVVARCGMSGSAWMRAIQLMNSATIRGSVNNHRRVVSEYEFLEREHRTLTAGDVVVFVKLHGHPLFPVMVEQVQRVRAFAVLDVVDDWVSRIRGTTLLDAIIFSNSLHVRYAKYHLNARRHWIIPHHHSNFDHLKNSQVLQSGLVRTVGTSSGPGQQMSTEYRHYIKQWAAFRGVRFVEHTFVEQILDARGRPLSTARSLWTRASCVLLGGSMLPGVNQSSYQQNAEIHRQINHIELAIIVPEPDPAALAYKPNTRLAMFQSHGIPVLVGPYQSYWEADRNHSSSLLFTSPPELLQLLDSLFHDPERVKSMATAALRAAQTVYSLDAIASRYLDLFSTLHH